MATKKETTETGAFSPVAEAKSEPLIPVSKAKAAVNPSDSCGFCIYIGPTIRGKLNNGAVFQGGKAAVITRLADLIEQYPQVKTLVVTDQTFSGDRIKVKKTGNYLHSAYQDLVQQLTGE